MKNENYKVYVFADSEYSDEYGLPKLHVRTPSQNITSDWIALASQLRMHYGHSGLPEYKIPKELRKLKSIRELSRGEIGILEASILGCPMKN